MRKPRRTRILSGEETRLWGEIAKLITPLRGRAVPAPPPASAPVPAPAGAPRKPVAAAPTASEKRSPRKTVRLADVALPAPRLDRIPAPVVAPPGPGFAGLERKERRGLHRGSLAIEARIDLHGMLQAEAHFALIGFLTRARASGLARVLVVTGKGGMGKGGASEEAIFSGRGVLRRSVPHWLRGPELRGLVLGFEEAARHHGGGGALYVRLRRR